MKIYKSTGASEERRMKLTTALILVILFSTVAKYTLGEYMAYIMMVASSMFFLCVRD